MNNQNKQASMIKSQDQQTTKIYRQPKLTHSQNQWNPIFTGIHNLQADKFYRQQMLHHIIYQHGLSLVSFSLSPLCFLRIRPEIACVRIHNHLRVGNFNTIWSGEVNLGHSAG